MNFVTLVSVGLCAAIGIWGVIAPENMTGAAQGLVNYTLSSYDWFYMALCTAFVVIMVAMALTSIR